MAENSEAVSSRTEVCTGKTITELDWISQLELNDIVRDSDLTKENSNYQNREYLKDCR